MNEIELWKQQAADFGTSTRIFTDDPKIAEAFADDNINFSEDPVEHFEFDDILEEDFDGNVRDIDRVDYAVAAACGVLTAALDIFWLDKFSFNEVSSFGVDQINKFVLKVSRVLGYVGNDIDEAVRKIEQTARMLKNQKNRHLEDFGNHSSWVGICFSVLSQFTGFSVGADESGKLKIGSAIDQDLIGATTQDKILNGILIWAFNMAGEMSAGRLHIEKGSGIPEPLASLIRDLSELPLISPSADRVKELMAILRPADTAGELIRFKNPGFSLQKEMGFAGDLIKTSASIVLNECLVRGFYMLRRFMMEVKDKKAGNIAGAEKIDRLSYLPYSNRTITRMMTVSSGTFAAITTAKAAVAGAAAFASGGWAGAAAGFVANINYGGLINFAFACHADSAYLAEDIGNIYREYVEWNNSRKAQEQKIFDKIRIFRLDAEQMRLVNSLQLHRTLYDIRKTEGKKALLRKESWIEDWSALVLKDTDKEPEEYFIYDEDALYRTIMQHDENDYFWVYLAALELDAFIPYYRIEGENQPGARLTDDSYIEEVFCQRQSIVSYTDIIRIRKKMEQYAGMLTGSEAETTAGVAAVALLTGGVSLIPRAIANARGVSAGKTYGQALAGVNTAVLKGAGSVANMFGQGNTDIFTSALHVPTQCARILALCDTVLTGRMNDTETIEQIRGYFLEQLISLENERNNLIMQDNNDRNAKRKISRLAGNIKAFSSSYESLTEMIR